jgi:hypothetical protein
MENMYSHTVYSAVNYISFMAQAESKHTGLSLMVNSACIYCLKRIFCSNIINNMTEMN